MHRTFSFRTAIKAAGALICTFTGIVLTTGCGDTGSSASGSGDTTMKYARVLRINSAEGYTAAEIINPWDTTSLLHRYILVPSDSPVPECLPEGSIIRTPVDHIIVYSSVHASIIDMLGAADRISGVCEPEYMTCRAVKERVADGSITDCGNSVSPSIEKIAQAGGEIIIASPFQNSSYGAAGKLGIPIIEAADYMEILPLGRTEWVRLFGVLLDRETQADSIFQKAESEYNSLKDMIQRHIDSLGGESHRPTLLAERRYGSSWDVPGGRSYMARMYRDAGAAYIFGGTTTSANVNMSFENVLQKGMNADIWVMKYWSGKPMSYSSLESEYPLYSGFDAFRKHRIFGCNTYESSYYDDIVLNPALILKDLAAVFHPDLFPEYTAVYFKPLNL